MAAKQHGHFAPKIFQLLAEYVHFQTVSRVFGPYFSENTAFDPGVGMGLHFNFLSASPCQPSSAGQTGKSHMIQLLARQPPDGDFPQRKTNLPATFHADDNPAIHMSGGTSHVS